MDGLIKSLDEQIKELMDERYDLRFRIEAIDDKLAEARMLRHYYDILNKVENGLITVKESSKTLLTRPSPATRSRSKSPTGLKRSPTQHKLNYGIKPERRE